MRLNEFLNEEAVKQRLDPKCWKGKHKEGTKIKGGVRVNNCVPNESIEEEWSQKYKDSINCSNPKGFSQKAHCAGKQKNEDFNGEYDDEAGMAHSNLHTIARAAQGLLDTIEDNDNLPEWVQEKIAKVEGMLTTALNYLQSQEAQGIDPKIELSADQQFDMIEEMVEQLALAHGVDAEVIWEDFESVDDHELLETAAWKKKAGKNKNGGLNAKGVASYRREHPGSKLQTAVTTKPSKLKKGSKAAKRRKSFCARMSGVKGPMKKPNGDPTRKALALRKWNC
jgi:hypothetical protein